MKLAQSNGSNIVDLGLVEISAKNFRCIADWLEHNFNTTDNVNVRLEIHAFIGADKMIHKTICIYASKLELDKLKEKLAEDSTCDDYKGKDDTDLHVA